uniref:DUF7041 domain-containing protein n=1 Tax=Amphimedon queenslandica TaxID=400682 RepID=A0A1X7U989_AMPQE
MLLLHHSQLKSALIDTFAFRYSSKEDFLEEVEALTYLLSDLGSLWTNLIMIKVQFVLWCLKICYHSKPSSGGIVTHLHFIPQLDIIVIASLYPEFASEVNDLILKPPSTNPYDALSSQLIKHTTAFEQRRLQQLFNTEKLGDRTLFQLLR